MIRPTRTQLLVGDVLFAVENVWRAVRGQRLRKRSGFMVREIYRSPDGTVEVSGWRHNSLMNEGERNVLDLYLRGQNAPSSFYVRLFGFTPQENFSLASMSNEPGGLRGYAPQPIARNATASGWPVLSDVFSGGDFQAESVEVVFRAGGVWPTVTHATLSTSSDNTGLLVDAVALAQARSLRSGGELAIQYLCRLS